MGIPSYFSYVVKNHPEIIKKYTNNDVKMNNLYLDCNSVVYDVYSRMDVKNLTEEISISIIKQVCLKIESYIQLIGPDKKVIIAFDGVAPVAKLEQQRSRRYKSLYQNEISKEIYNKTTPDPWNTVAITPGTHFMKQLNDYVVKYFNDAKKYNLDQLIVSTSEQCGEGEHKIFNYIRKNANMHKEESTVIYGLDADLIMLSINHLPICPQIYLFRETPHFIQSIDKSLEPNANYLLDIPLLSQTTTFYMNNDKTMDIDQQNNRIYDYIFLSFFLGNDFLPHFPALNIRTGGMDKMLNAYRGCLGKTNDALTNGKKINWNNLRKLVQVLALQEEEFIKKEHNDRNKKEHFNYPTDTPENVFKKFEAKPTYEREVEKYINPFKEGWENRYYRSLFHIHSDSTGSQRKEICINYLEGLEWTFKYYSQDCPNWRWSYKYNYPPLLSDLIKYIPAFDTTFIIANLKPVSQLVQLCYVLPKASLSLLPKKLYSKLLEDHPEWYNSNCEFSWAFCRYFWESHVLMEDIDIDELEKYIYTHKNLLV